jgi:hypothetical protein
MHLIADFCDRPGDEARTHCRAVVEDEGVLHEVDVVLCVGAARTTAARAAR